MKWTGLQTNRNLAKSDAASFFIHMVHREQPSVKNCLEKKNECIFDIIPLKLQCFLGFSFLLIMKDGGGENNLGSVILRIFIRVQVGGPETNNLFC
jgi:hypothetical protein